MNLEYIKSIPAISSIFLAAALTGCSPNGNPTSNAELTNSSNYVSPVTGTDNTVPAPTTGSNSTNP